MPSAYLCIYLIGFCLQPCKQRRGLPICLGLQHALVEQHQVSRVPKLGHLNVCAFRCGPPVTRTLLYLPSAGRLRLEQEIVVASMPPPPSVATCERADGQGGEHKDGGEIFVGPKLERLQRIRRQRGAGWRNKWDWRRRPRWRERRRWGAS